jgi:hypothetical protein
MEAYSEKKSFLFNVLLFFSYYLKMPRTTKEKGKGKASDGQSKAEAFSQLLIGGEEDFEGYLQENETLKDEAEEPEITLEPMDNNEDDDDDDDDNDSLNAWMEDDSEEYIVDNEIT